MEKVTLKCGTRLLLTERILVRRIYSGVIEGRPDAAINARLSDGFTNWVRQVTGCDTPHVVEPEIDEAKRYPRLPEYACAIELTSFEPVLDKGADMSSAVVIWFQSPSSLHEPTRVIDILKELKWVDIAKDGYW